MTQEWKLHATNVATKQPILYTMVKLDGKPSSSLYKARGRVFRNFSEAVLETAEYGNAALEYIVVETHWGGRNIMDEKFFIYTPKGGKLGSKASLSEALEFAIQASKFIPKRSEVSIQRRRQAYLDAKDKRHKVIKRHLIEKEKGKILDAKKNAKETEKYKDTAGSW